MTTTAETRRDEDVVAEMLGVLQDARGRAPRDFLFVLAGGLGLGAIVFLVVGLATDGVARDMSLNMSVQLIGTWLTVVVIDGLWKRQEAGASATLDAMSRRLAARRGLRLTPAEREAWLEMVEDYQALVRTESIVHRIRSLRSYRRRR